MFICEVDGSPEVLSDLSLLVGNVILRNEVSSGLALVFEPASY